MSDPQAVLHPQTPWDSVKPEPAPGAAPDDVLDLSIAGDQSVAIAPTESSSDGWTIPLISVGIAMIACCILIPLGDINRRLTYDREKLAGDLKQIDQQIAVNDEFLTKINDDPTLAERLALRQMKVVRKGSAVLELTSSSQKQDSSPFLLVNVPAPPPMLAYRPSGGRLAQLCRDRQSRLYITGAGLLCLATGLVLGASSSESKDAEE